jgi:hypothetical protein
MRGSTFDSRRCAGMLGFMSVAQITSAIDRLSPAELAQVSAHLRRRFCEDTPERRREISKIMAEMDAGKKFSLTDLKRKDEELRRSGS